MAPTLDQDLAALLADLDDAQEADTVRLLMETATETPWHPADDLEYKPFVYPH